jgi:flagellar biosynthetic protein FliR
MNQLTLSHVLHALGGGESVTAFFLVLARVSPLFVIAPLFSAKQLPGQVRGLIAVGLAIGLAGVASHGQHIPTAPLQVAAMLVEQVMVGILLSFTVAAVIAAVQTAGGLADITSGFAFGATVDPINGNPGGVFAELYTLIGVMLFIAIGGDAWILHGLARTFTLVPLTAAPHLGSIANAAEVSVASLFTSAIEVAAPVMLALLISDVAFGLVSKVVPQMNVFSVAFPLKVGVAIAVVAASLPFLGGWISDQMYTSVATALHAL